MDDAAREGGGRLRLHYLDGFRGIAALWVVLHHAFLEVAAVKGWLPERWHAWTRWAWDGQIGVQVFIVLSGYCLMMPVARAGHLKGGVGEFIARRARRILPPYYAALGLALAVIALVPGMARVQGVRWDVTLPAFTPGVVLSHLFLFQDWRMDWIFRINYPMWTIAQEWQLYFVFAVVLLPLWRRAGLVVTLAAALVVSVVLHRLPGGRDFAYACPEFLFLFTVGMAAAVVNFAPPAGRLAAWCERTPWAWGMAACWAVYAVCTLAQTDVALFSSTRFALLAAPAMFCTLVSCTRAAQDRRTGGRHAVLSLCERGPVVVLGTFSYSLYLVHALVLSGATLLLRDWQVPGALAVAAQCLVAVPLAMAVSYGFHLVAERPFLLGRPVTLPRAEKAAILDPAP